MGEILMVICLDCEEQWELDYEPARCDCWDPADNAWLLYIKDNNGKWVKSFMEAMKERHGDI